jgi:hypothetical protein
VRQEIDTSEVRSVLAEETKAKQAKGEDARAQDGRPVWTLRLTTIETERVHCQFIANYDN